MSSKLPEIALPKSLEVQWHDEVALLRIVRPEKRNALDDPTVLGIDTFFSSIPEHVKAVVVEAGGENFSAGLDLSEMTERSTIGGVMHSMMWHTAFAKIEFGRVPVVSVLKGAVVGGGLELASATHIRIAEKSAYYALPEGQRGIYVGGGASVRVPRLIGVHRMADMMLTGRVSGHGDLALSRGEGTGAGKGSRSCRQDRLERADHELCRHPSAPPNRPGEPA
jgi:enoyl-CoA hydratase/carnithine racemase